MQMTRTEGRKRKKKEKKKGTLSSVYTKCTGFSFFTKTRADEKQNGGGKKG